MERWKGLRKAVFFSNTELTEPTEYFSNTEYFRTQNIFRTRITRISRILHGCFFRTRNISEHGIFPNTEYFRTRITRISRISHGCFFRTRKPQNKRMQRNVQRALKGQPAPSPGQHPGFRQDVSTNALKGQKRYNIQRKNEARKTPWLESCELSFFTFKRHFYL